MPSLPLPSAVDLARAQFALTVVWHFLFPAFTIGLASFLAVLEGRWLFTGKAVYLDTYRYWLKVFAVAFAMGVVSGLVMSYQFGTNWSVFADRTAPILGPLLGYEVLTAFFLEAGFLGVMLFGLARVGPRLHFAATCLVALGTLTSAFWILSANSWMQTPTGHTMGADGRFAPADWWAIIVNPSFPYRFAHTVTGAYLTTAMIVGAVGALHLLRDGKNPRARAMFSMAMWMAALVAPAQLVIGDMHGANTYAHQPAKVAAMEGHFETRSGASALLFGWPDAEAGETRGALGIPGLASLYLTHDLNGTVRGLNDMPRATWPTNLPLVFWSFRVMVGLGLLMIALGLASLWLRWKGRLYDAAWFHRLAVAMGPSGLIAVTAGWTVTETGRQPFTVYGLLRTADSVSPVAAPAVAASLAAFAVVYLAVFGAGIWYLLHLFNQAPHVHEAGPPTGVPTRTAGITPAPALDAPAHGESRPALQPAE
ncbi:Cytochrome bd ubiquinol oxidase subunit 1 [Methylobacterium adhaesivum]|uniref:Cytochrome ubiquinol oxidase subunit I n=1 Tax=Methylobacterium adhaesivum TaxID=333297 RepID=A0ABT8BN94_9HYPH|nr:cytochrome ubiquinol oxidase subunit I [Methylobacterium adhaesivum]MDN3593002.1 cytochrome ubiquinol oxidase subunit I [Methylobacterium adhaesivum]GJD30943.1 Cytochrome bd ubiquinol oxidase subunit 1 [Methylobacterium adhaesivum]